MKAPSTPTLPKCRDCGGPNPRVVSSRTLVGVPGVEVASHEWLCASCEYNRMSETARKRLTIPTPPAFRDVLLAMARSAAREREPLAV